MSRSDTEAAKPDTNIVTAGRNCRTPRAAAKPITSRPATAGGPSRRTISSREARPQGRAGPMPIMNTMEIAMGTPMRLK